MKKPSHSLLPLLGLTLALSSCGIYSRYQRPTGLTTEVYRTDQAALASADSSTSLGRLPWRQLFTDPQLQLLIEEVLRQNVDLQTAALSVRQAEAQLKAARLSFFPSLSLAPSVSTRKVEGVDATHSYELPVQASWQVDLFGSLLNASRSTQVQLLRAQEYQRLVQSRLIASVANGYYTLLMLDRQLALSQEAAQLAQRTLEVMQAQKEHGRALESAVQSARAALHQVQASLPEIKRQRIAAENSLALLLGQSPRSYERSTLEAQSLPEQLSVGLPVQLLSQRPDVRVSELALANCYYQTNAARSAFYPTLSINGSLGWVGSLGQAVANPMRLVSSAVGALAQPIFARGRLVAGLRVAEAEQKKALLAFQQSLLSAGAEVSNALALYEASTERVAEETKQIESLKTNVAITEELFRSGRSSSYLEVISAQQALLQAQLTEVRDRFSRMQAVVNLYNALGGGADTVKP